MLYIYIVNNNILKDFNILKQQYKNKYLFLYSNYNNDNYINILCKIDAFIKIINNSNKTVIFLNGFFIKPKQIYYYQYNNINNIIKNKLKKKAIYIYIKKEPKKSLLNYVNSIKNTCCICLEENNDIILNCSRCIEGKICYDCYTKYNKNNCCICNNNINTNIIKKKESEFYNNYYDYNIYLQDRKNVIVI